MAVKGVDQIPSLWEISKERNGNRDVVNKVYSESFISGEWDPKHFFLQASLSHGITDLYRFSVTQQLASQVVKQQLPFDPYLKYATTSVYLRGGESLS